MNKLYLTYVITILILAFPNQILAATYWLPDYQDGFAQSANKDSLPNDDAASCKAYGFLSACPAGQVGTAFHPYAELTCYKDCKVPCPAKVEVADSEQCSEYCQGICVKKVCKAAVSYDNTSEICIQTCASDSSVCISKSCKPNVSYDTNTENCTTFCKSNSSVCVAKSCKPRVSYDSNTEVCSATCHSDTSICVAKSCKSRVSVDTASERCLAYCASNKSICVSKGCMSSVTVNTGEQCVLYCRSNASSCVTKSCKDGYVDLDAYWCNGALRCWVK